MKNLLVYKECAKNFEEATPIGNGHIGAMVYGGCVTGINSTEKILLNDDTLWNKGCYDSRDNPEGYNGFREMRKLILEGKPKEAEFIGRLKMLSIPREQGTYQPLGEVHMILKNHEGNVSDYLRFLDMNTAVTAYEYVMNNVKYKRETFVSFADDALIVRVKSDTPGAITLNANITRRPFNGVASSFDDCVIIKGRAGSHGVNYAVCLAGIGDYKIIGDSIVFENADEAVLVITSATDYYGDNPSEKVKETSEKVRTMNYNELLARHIEKYSELFSRVEFNLNENTEVDLTSTAGIDEIFEYLKKNGYKTAVSHINDAKKGVYNTEYFELFFQYGRYLMISSSYGKCLPANLQGIWNEAFAARWESKYTINANIQMNYWLAEVLNLPECHMPLFDFVENSIENGRNSARKMYNCGGFVFHNNLDGFCDTAITGEIMDCTVWPMGGAWLALHFWDHYEYTRDLTFLKNRAYPLMKESIEFFCDYLYESEDGYLLTGPSVSPENKFEFNGEKVALCMSPTMDVGILNELFAAFIKTSEILDIKDEFYTLVCNMKSKLPPIRVLADGRIAEWLDDYKETELGHRHISHLFALMPGTQITLNEKELFDAAKKTIDFRMEHGGGHTGWSAAWVSCFWARLFEREKSYECLKILLRNNILYNFFDVHAPGEVFQIDANFGGPVAMTEMLMQSHEGFIRLLPSLPCEWQSGSIKGICTRSGHKIDIYWKNGTLDYAVVYPGCDDKIKLCASVAMKCDNVLSKKDGDFWFIEIDNTGCDKVIIYNCENN